MSGGNLSPRQKMIGMMYLVLTALLALNVSKDILDAFVLINTSLENTVVNYDKKNEILYADFNKAKLFDPVKVTPYWKKAQKAKQHSLDLIRYIKELQIKLLQETEKITNAEADTLQLKYANSKDNYDIPTHIMIGQTEDGSTGLARELKNKLDNYKTTMLSLFNEQERKTLNIDLKTGEVKSGEGIETWEIGNFYNTPLAATITLLSKIQTDIKNTEYEVINKLFQSVGEEDYNFDTVAAKIISTSNYVLLGEKYNADVFVAAFSTTQNPEILIGEYDSVNNKLINVKDTVPVVKGLGNYSIPTTREGVFNYEGVIKLKNPGSEAVKLYPFKSEYIVARPSLVVSPDKMNVFYIGPDNPVSISVPGVASENISATITGTGNRISKTSNGHYNVKLGRNSPRNIDVNVSATMPNGTNKNMGKMSFVVKRLPKPYAEVGSISLVRGVETKNQLKTHTKVKAKYGADFPFTGLPLNVAKYKVEIYRGAIQLDYWNRNTSVISVADQNRFNIVRRNDMVYFSKIFARDVSGQLVPMNDVTIKVR
jgi:gliding motility-associated protein GldM